MTSLKSVASWSLLLLMLMQFIPLNRINPPVVSDFQPPAVIKSSLKKACYDCHSNETLWPAIAYIAPFSWLLSSTVSSGRNVLNFSLWKKCQTGKTNLQKAAVNRILENYTMHQPLYYSWNPEANLSNHERKIVLSWISDSIDEPTSHIKNSENNHQDRGF
ncbi:MAG: heme-binding domain-containing protein [Chlorobiaceae bacterium]|nr:heme-binding domain-containing protein [Chlorobiaceae bacterium]